MWAINRVKSHKKREQMDADWLDAESADLWTMYEQRLQNITDRVRFLQPYDEHCKVIVAKFGQNMEAVDAAQDCTAKAQATVTANIDDIQIL
ncbi:unnamed protein product [Ixodes pacificus]